MIKGAEQKYSIIVNSFIPIFYIAWADGMLSPSEVDLIKSKIERLESATPEDLKLLESWLNTNQWPDEKTFKSWLYAIKKATQKNQRFESIESVVDLGINMARNSIVGDQGHNNTLEEIHLVLKELEEEMGFPNLKKFSNLIPEKEIDHPVRPHTSEEIHSWLEGKFLSTKREITMLLVDPIFERQYFETKEIYRKKVLQWLQILADRGLGSIAYPETVGGKNDMYTYARVFETLAYHDLSLTVKFGVQFGLFGGAIQHLGTEKHHNLYLNETGRLAIKGCFAMTETGHGSNVRGIETLGTYDHENRSIIIHSPNFEAGKEYIGNALDATLAVVFLQLVVNQENHGVHAVIVPIRDKNHHELPGIKVEDSGYKMGLNGVDNGRIWFNQVSVPVENLLDRFGFITAQGEYSSPIENDGKRFFSMLGTLVGGRICVGKAANSVSKSALTIATKYALQRRQFQDGKSKQERLIIHYPIHQWRIIPKIASTYAIHFALEKLLVDSVSKNIDPRKIETDAAALKVLSTDHCTSVVQESREACGGKGYLYENRLPDLKADSDIFTTFEGDNIVLLQLVARGLLTEFREEFSDEGIMSVFKIVSKRMNQTLATINPLQKRKTDASHLLDLDFHLEALAFKYDSLLMSLAGRLRNMIRKRIPPYDAFIRCQNHMINLAKTYAELLVQQSFVQQIRSGNTDDDAKHLLTKLCRLNGLFAIYSNRSWFLEKDYIHKNKSNAIRRQIERLCWDLVPDLQTVVDGFGIPKGILDAPIAQNYPT